ncbi:MAG: hypothetical protein QOF32_2574 [Gammaproteobacteria bacterium]|jgi:hypothetical protein|nr:hypothetical protein [Gammaproteobacteria bacterium]
MNYTTILRNGTPWLVCSPDDKEELNRFKATAAGADTLTDRPATPVEAGRLCAEKALRSFRGEEPDKLFGTAL